MGKVSPFITTADCYLFSQGTHYEIYRKLGAHLTVCQEEPGVYFAVWAPRAVSVHVAGSFNDWSIVAHPMTPIADSGIFECFIPGLKPGETYKYAIQTMTGAVLMKSDPYGAQAELRPANASMIVDTDSYEWHDREWIAKRGKNDFRSTPCAIYEVHPGSWKQNDGQFLNYRQLAHELADYILRMGYTHVELMGIAEHPFDGSWGYQVTGYYAATSRHGSPEDFMYLVDHLHQKGIGVILDWVPAHFSRDSHGLADFDGTPTYEYADPRKSEHPHWGTKVFDYGKRQVSNFLIANALYWVEQFHVDGLRVDAVASMLYLDYGKNYDQCSTTPYGGHGNPEAVQLLKHLNEIMERRNPGTLMIAEESSSWPMVTGPAHQGGLGFSFKWNMGWMHDFLEYMQLHPLLRSDHHDQMTFSMTYAFRENFILVLSHDEVVHLKRSLLSKMPGSPDEQFANLKAAYTFMMGHPGKKLLFMGQDFGQWQEWDESKALDWHLLNDERHRELHEFYRDLLHLYKNTPAMYEDDTGWDGFQWLNCDDAERSIFSFIRKSRDSRSNLLFVCNFAPTAHEDYRVGVPCQSQYQLVMDERGMCKSLFSAEAVPCDGQLYSIAHPLAAYGIQIYRFDFPEF